MVEDLLVIEIKARCAHGRGPKGITQSEQLFHINIFVREPLTGRLAFFLFKSSSVNKRERELKHPVCKYKTNRIISIAVGW